MKSHDCHHVTQGCQEEKSRISIFQDYEPFQPHPKGPPWNCFKVTGIGRNCELEFKINYTVNSASEICLNFGNSGLKLEQALILRCQKQCMTQHHITFKTNGYIKHLVQSFTTTLTDRTPSCPGSLLKTTPTPQGYPWVSRGWYVTPEPRFSGLVLDHQSSKEQGPKKLSKQI